MTGEELDVWLERVNSASEPTVTVQIDDLARLLTHVLTIRRTLSRIREALAEDDTLRRQD